MPMLTPYERMVEKLGEDGARQEMRRRRSLVKSPGLANVSKTRRKQIAKKAWETKHANQTSQRVQKEVRPVSE